jgi:hypothetical protein
MFPDIDLYLVSIMLLLDLFKAHHRKVLVDVMVYFRVQWVAFRMNSIPVLNHPASSSRSMNSERIAVAFGWLQSSDDISFPASTRARISSGPGAEALTLAIYRPRYGMNRYSILFLNFTPSSPANHRKARRTIAKTDGVAEVAGPLLTL